MPKQKMLKSKKAISPILATLLLIVIAVAAIVVTYAWIMTYMGSAGQQAGVIPYKANVRFYTEGGAKKIDIDIGNRGTSDTQISKIYCGLTPGNLVEQTPVQSMPITVGAGSIETVTINYDWTPGTTYYFKVVFTTGHILSDPPWSEQAPAS
ncbi:MAG: archaellin/type IV pilin N-terminal domain-containing protein [Candidatus Bathyarchaeia archaeon]